MSISITNRCIERSIHAEIPRHGSIFRPTIILVTVEAFELFKNDLQFVCRDARSSVPHLKAQFAAASAYAQQHRAFGVAKGVCQKVLQDAAQ